MQALAIVCTMAVCLSPMTNQRQWQIHKSKHEAAKVISQVLRALRELTATNMERMSRKSVAFKDGERAGNSPLEIADNWRTLQN